MPPKKTKFVSINAPNSTNTAAILPGRQRCECQAVTHDLINNCLSCGRIVCAQEGTGPCYFCGELVLTKSDRAKVAAGNTKDAQRLIAKCSRIQKEADEQRAKQAQETKERLLEYDRTSARRTKVIDDQADYFSSDNPWISEEEKAVIKKKQEAYADAKNRLKKTMKVTIDLAGRRILEEAPELPTLEDFHFAKQTNPGDDRMTKESTSNANPILEKLQFVGDLQRTSKEGDSNSLLWSNRIQDAELQEMVDAGNCLSVLQPYASLIVEGIKQFEGRSWYTPVRGRLWISAGQKAPTDELIQQLQNTYRHIVGDVEFPTNYPLGCLLGCVDLVDCLPQEEYLQIYPKGEIADPYVLVFANPKLLSVKVPIQGKQKIFKLERHVHQAVKNTLK